MMSLDKNRISQYGPIRTRSWLTFTRTVRHRVLKWAPLVFRIIFWGVDFWSMLIGWRAANMSAMSYGEERNVGERSVLCLLNLALWAVC